MVAALPRLRTAVIGNFALTTMHRFPLHGSRGQLEILATCLSTYCGHSANSKAYIKLSST